MHIIFAIVTILVCIGTVVALKDVWRLRVTQVSTTAWESYFYVLTFYDLSGNVITGSYDSSAGNSGINLINDGDSDTSYRFPPSGSSTVGMFIKFTCTGGCAIGKVYLKQWSTADNRQHQMILESSENSGSTWSAESPAFNTNAAQTTYIVPTAAPTRVPTRSPTATPTLELTTCDSSCSLLTQEVAIAAGTIIARVSIPKYFRIAFEFRIAALALGSETRNIIDIQDVATGDSLVRIGATNGQHLRSAYNNVVYHQYGPQLLPDYTVDYTSCLLTFDGTNFLTWTDHNSAWYSTFPITTAEVTTAGKSFNILVSNFDVANPSAGGAIRNININCKFFTPCPLHL